MSKISPGADTIDQKDNILTQELENGPLERRSCKDIFCTLLW